MCDFCGNTSRLICMMVLVAAYFLVELIVGYVIHSIALVADAFHMLSDFMALIIGLIAARIARWPRSSKNTFGWQRAEVMGGLINTVMLITLCGTILLQAIQRFIEPSDIKDPRLMVYVGSGGLLVNILGLIVLGVHSHDGPSEPIEVTENDVLQPAPLDAPLRPDSDGRFSPISRGLDRTLTLDGKVAPLYADGKQMLSNDSTDHLNPVITYTNLQSGKSRKAKHAKSMNMRAVFLHVLADFFGSIIVVVSAVILEWAPGDKDAEGSWKLYVDPAMSVLMVLIILASAIPLMYKAALILLQSVPNEICLKNLKTRLENIDGIHKIHDLHVWRLQSNCIIGTVHIRCESLPDYLIIARKVKQLFHDFDIHCTTIQPEFEEYTEEESSREVDYQACVLDCGPNKNCQSDTCCPAPLSASNSSTSGTTSNCQPTVVNKLTFTNSSAVVTEFIPTSSNGPTIRSIPPSAQSENSGEVRLLMNSVTHSDDPSSTHV
ncbi:hypothetical protein AHF37_00236 [Paragonimus kellicotti]|nr:hypothetical protein AHF37_00236 [Paragonimus kellicotti]